MDDNRFTAARLGRDLATHLPYVVRNLAQLATGFRAFPRGTQQALMLRQAKLLGCPVCRAIFPRFAERAGLCAAEIEAAIHGDLERLPDEMAAALAWIEAVLAAGGGVPYQESPLSEQQREFLTFWTRFDLLVHDVGLFFLPHAWIERARV